jgi:hypothetical protein
MNKKYHFDGTNLYYEIVLGLKQNITSEDAYNVLSDALVMPEGLVPFEIKYCEYWGLRGMFMKDLDKVNAHYYFFQVCIPFVQDYQKSINFIKSIIKSSEYILKGDIFINEYIDLVGKKTIMLQQTIEAIEEAQKDDGMNVKEKFSLPVEYVKVSEALYKKN